MGTVLNPNTAAAYPSSLTGPADGDLANALSVNQALQPVADGVDLSRRLLFGRKLRPNYKVTDTGNLTGLPEITVAPLGSIVVTQGAGAAWYVVDCLTSQLLNLTTIFGGSLATKTRYYFYAHINAGVLAWNVDTVGPDPTLMYKNVAGGTDYAFVGTFLTDPTTSNLIYLSRESGGVHYINDAGIQVLANGQSSTAVQFDVVNQASSYGQLVPTYAAGSVRVWLAGLCGATDNVTFGSDLPPTAPIQFDFYTGVTLQIGMVTTMSPVDGVHLSYKWGAGGSGHNANAYVMGWTDPR